MGRKQSKNRGMLFIFLGGPTGLIQPLWAYFLLFALWKHVANISAAAHASFGRDST